MKVAIALLTDRETANVVNKTAWEIHRAHRTGLAVRRLPPHVSLKQPFDINDLQKISAVVARFAASIAPFGITLGDYQLWEHPSEAPTTGTLSLQVVETLKLRSLHNRLNAQLGAAFGEPVHAEFDGDGYAFHLTVAAGEGSVESYRAAFEERRAPGVRRHAFIARELALFVYEKPEGPGEWAYMVYETLPLGG